MKSINGLFKTIIQVTNRASHTVMENSEGEQKTEKNTGYRKGGYRTNHQNSVSDVAVLSATEKKLQRILQRPLRGAIGEKLTEVATVRKNLQKQVDDRRIQELKAAVKVGVAYREDKMQSNHLKKMKTDLIALGTEQRKIKIILGWME